jgi:hypothetical protein
MMPPEAGPAAVPRPVYRLYHKVGSVLFACFCFGIGLFLVLFPWTGFWESNFFSALVPEWHGYWGNSYVRGAVSGLGVVNLYISLVEIARLRRFSGR